LGKINVAVRFFSGSDSNGSVMRRNACKGALGLLLLAAALLTMTARPLLARSRDDVLTGMFRCAPIGDVRTWLDCFYGAAQPLRSELGLPPAPASQVQLSRNPPAAVPSTSDLNPRYQVTTDALRCNNLGDDRQWLSCYYEAAQPVRAQLGLSPAPQAPAGVAKPGANVNPGGAPGRVASRVERPGPAIPNQNQGWLQLASYSFNRYGIFTLSLSNGQQWRQLSGDTSLAHWTKPPAHYWVRISRGALGSVNLKIKGDAAAYKVERID